MKQIENIVITADLPGTELPVIAGECFTAIINIIMLEMTIIIIRRSESITLPSVTNTLLSLIKHIHTNIYGST